MENPADTLLGGLVMGTSAIYPSPLPRGSPSLFPSPPISSFSPIPMKLTHPPPGCPHLAHPWASCHGARCVPQEGLGAEQVGGKAGERSQAAQSLGDRSPRAESSNPPFSWARAAGGLSSLPSHLPKARLGGRPPPPGFPHCRKSPCLFSLCQGAPGISVAGMKVSGTLLLNTEGLEGRNGGGQSWGFRGSVDREGQGQIGLGNTVLKASFVPGAQLEQHV